MNRKELMEALEELDLTDRPICLEGVPNDCWYVERVGKPWEPKRWEVYYSERGGKYESVFFESEEEAYDHLYEIAKRIKARRNRM